MGHDRVAKSIVANFGEDLRFSQDLSEEPAWAEYYLRLFPTLVSHVLVPQDGPMQRSGIDRILILASGQQITVDEKLRRTKFNDILLERWSDLERYKPGWTADPTKACDYVAYAIPVLAKCFFLPFPLLKAAFLEHYDDWHHRYFKPYHDVRNEYNGRSWTTRNVPVTWPVLKGALEEQMHRRYSGDIVLPTPRVVTDDSSQLTLAYDST